MILLLDVDGVLQFGPADAAAHMRSIGWKGDYRAFQQALFRDDEYRAALVGKGDIRAVIARMLRSFGQDVGADLLMQQWVGAHVSFNHELLTALPSLACDGIHLATNQDPVRATWVRDTYAGRDGVGRIYFSHEVGHRKPFAEYFRFVIDDLDSAAGDIVFVDDSEENVAGAASCGITAVRYVDNATLLGRLGELGIATRR